jgi:hypothetical protein
VDEDHSLRPHHGRLTDTCGPVMLLPAPFVDEDAYRGAVRSRVIRTLEVDGAPPAASPSVVHCAVPHFAVTVRCRTDGAAVADIWSLNGSGRESAARSVVNSLWRDT